jgi:YggT family protein
LLAAAFSGHLSFMKLLDGYAAFIGVTRVVVLWAAVAMAAVCVLDWAIRTRRISPFSGLSRFFRSNVDPLFAPVERTLVRAGGRPTNAPFWALLAIAVGGMLLIYILELVGGLMSQLASGFSSPSAMLRVMIGWVFGLLRLALLVRVLSTWLPISPYSRWIRWSYVLTEWMLRPLRSVIPMIGPIDITPRIAFFALGLIQSAIGA